MSNLATVVEENIHKEFSIIEDNRSEMWIAGLLKNEIGLKQRLLLIKHGCIS